MEYTQQVILLIVLAIVAAIDIKQRKIPNFITFPLMIAGVCFSFIQGSYIGAGFSLLGIVLAFLLFFLPYAFGTLGAGDVKLMMGIGSWIGSSMIVFNGITVMIVGGVLASLSLAIKVHPTYPIKLIKGLFFAIILKDLENFLKGVKEHSTDSIPYGVAIFIGTVITTWLY
ncbi:A24 family peptidase [Halalkalibacter alkalisediminis]|uniref:Prepilin peptidase n=1 Tax=Halalkalibacter alkalisediminis TaxID=935616 RepID=A0ABV6NLX8_9BACI|nr:prepilin peptidase [Halalkalibacter alkalisediminis]